MHAVQRFWNPRRVLLHRVFSLLCPHRRSSVSIPRPCGSCSCGASAYRCRSLQPAAAAGSMSSGTTGQRALARGCAGPGTIPLERAAARVCREAGATVACNVLIRNLNVGLDVDRFDDWRIEGNAKALALGAQLAVDVTFVSARDTHGAPRRDRYGAAGTAFFGGAQSKGAHVPRVAALAAVPARRPGP